MLTVFERDTPCWVVEVRWNPARSATPAFSGAYVSSAPRPYLAVGILCYVFEAALGRTLKQRDGPLFLVLARWQQKRSRRAIRRQVSQERTGLSKA